MCRSRDRGRVGVEPGNSGSKGLAADFAAQLGVVSASPTFPIATTNLSHKHREPLFAPYHACLRSVLETAPMPRLPLQDPVHRTAPFDWKTLRVERDGQTVVVPCLSFTLWFGVTEAPLLLDFYERAMEALG